MERYCTFDKKTIRGIDRFKWEGDKDFKEMSLSEIYIQMLKAYYSDQSLFERYRMLIGKTNEQEFLEHIYLKNKLADNHGSNINQNQILNKNTEDIDDVLQLRVINPKIVDEKGHISGTIKEEDLVNLNVNTATIESGIQLEIAKGDPISKITDEDEQENPMVAEDLTFLYNMNLKENQKTDNVVQNIIRNQIIQCSYTSEITQIEKANEYLYLDILQALLYSLKYCLSEDTMIYLNPYQEYGKDNIDKKDFAESWRQFKRKGTDRIRRENNKTKKDVKDIKMLSDFAVEVPLDTKVEITNRNITKIHDFAPNVIRFFIEREQEEGRSKYTILDLLSKKRRDRFTLSDYTKLNIEGFQKKFEKYIKDSDKIIEQFLFEQCLGLDISEYVYEFIENVIFIDKIVNEEVKNSLAGCITALVRELRLCEPMLSKKLILDATATILKYCPQSTDEYQETNIQYACSRLNQAVQIEQELIKELNYVYRGFSKCFFYALSYSVDGDLSMIDKMICNEIKRVKEKLEEGDKEGNRIKYREKKGYDALFPYIQKAMMVER